jgi:pimeloyl-ACP methyl ester carboxylesterase
MLIVGPPRYYQRVFSDELCRSFEIVFGNMRAFVPPPQGFDTTLSRDTYSDDIEAIRRASGLDRPVVVGHSIAGTMVFEHARRYPTSVRGVLAGGGVRDPDGPGEDAGLTLTLPAGDSRSEGRTPSDVDVRDPHVRPPQIPEGVRTHTDVARQRTPPRSSGPLRQPSTPSKVAYGSVAGVNPRRRRRRR